MPSRHRSAPAQPHGSPAPENPPNHPRASHWVQPGQRLSGGSSTGRSSPGCAPAPGPRRSRRVATSPFDGARLRAPRVGGLPAPAARPISCRYRYPVAEATGLGVRSSPVRSSSSSARSWESAISRRPRGRADQRDRLGFKEPTVGGRPRCFSGLIDRDLSLGLVVWSPPGGGAGRASRRTASGTSAIIGAHRSRLQA